MLALLLAIGITEDVIVAQFVKEDDEKSFYEFNFFLLKCEFFIKNHNYTSLRI